MGSFPQAVKTNGMGLINDGSQVLVEWGESDEGAGSLDLIIRYRCLEFPKIGSFYIILWDR